MSLWLCRKKHQWVADGWDGIGEVFYKVYFSSAGALLDREREKGLERALRVFYEQQGLVWSPGSLPIREGKLELEDIFGGERDRAREWFARSKAAEKSAISQLRGELVKVVVT
jgi:hypothetical protein